MVTVALVDDHAIVRQGLHALLESDPNLKVVGEAANGPEALKLVKRKKPQVVICDLMMPGLNGLEITRKVMRLKFKTQIIMLSMYRNEAYVLEALKGGAAGYVVKESSGAELFQAIRVVVAGQRYVSPSLCNAPAVSSYLKKTLPASLDPYSTLTSREQDVLHMVVQWGGRRDIGDTPKVGSGIGEPRRTNLMRKLGLNTHHNLIRYAMKRDSISMDAQKSLGRKDADISGTEHRSAAPESNVPPVNRKP